VNAPAACLAACLVATLAGCSHSPSPLTPNLVGSVGLPAHGTLSAGVELPAEGPGYRWFNPRGSHYGLPRLVEAIAAAAREVERERPGGVPLLVGDLSRESGGRIEHHHSHRSGRDADLLFFAETPAGEPVQSPGFVRYGSDGLAAVPGATGDPDYLRLDVAREWLLVRALMMSARANVQWLFISSPLEALLTEYARARGEDPELIWRAENVMLQPKDSLPHDDHLHLRTACMPEEAAMGCEGGGPSWSWLPSTFDSPVNESDDTLLVALLAPISSEASSAAASLVSLPSRDESVRGIAPSNQDRAFEPRHPPRGN
jgi:penicillin-insensitive murein endopeptidase